MRGYEPGRFSFNVTGGRCEACEGDGQIKIEMHFLPDVYVTCEVCGGKRYDRETLAVRYKGLNIAEILDLPVEQAHELFRNVPTIERVLRDAATTSGLGYIRARPAGDDALRRRGAARQARRASCASARPGARSTSSTSRRPASTSTTSASCSSCCTGWSTWATRWSSSSTTSTSSRPPTG